MKVRIRYGLKIIAIIFSLVMLITFLLTLPLRWLNPPFTAFTLSDDNVSSLNLRDKWVDYNEVSPEVFLAIIASEDQRFPDHFGFDFVSLKKALSEKRSSPRGASTITQQLIKNLYLWSGRSLFRKGIEAWLTIWLEVFVDKKRILELYVNVVEFGPGVYGIGYAADTFYQRKAKQLYRFQASILAAVLPNPKRYSVESPSNYVVERSKNIQRSMQALGGIGILNNLD